MTDERAFQAGLDAEPGNWQLRLIFADWLEEWGDPRARGYRALGVNRKQPQPYDDQGNTPKGRPTDSWNWWDDLGIANDNPYDLFRDWFRRLRGGKCDDYRRGYATRQKAEDAAARAFIRLPLLRQANLLNPKSDRG